MCHLTNELQHCVDIVPLEDIPYWYVLTDFHETWYGRNPAEGRFNMIHLNS